MVRTLHLFVLFPEFFFSLIDPTDEVNSPKAGKSASSSKSEGFYSKALEGNGTENSDLTLEERMFLQNADKEKPQSNCVIC